jgi:hypothetical protein
MLAFGVAAGLVGGYMVWSRPDPIASRTEITDTTVAVEPAARAGREFTEGTIADPARQPRLAAPRPRPDAVNVRLKPENVATYEGRLLVRSTPAGATVFVDGREFGVTPVAVRALAPGAHRVRLVRDGYAPAERRIVVTRSRPAQSIVVPLAEPRTASLRGTAAPTAPSSTPATMGRYTGGLVVESKPSGAKVYVDDRLVGTTPLSLPQISAGSHAVRLERDGYRRWSGSVRILAAERNRVTASLEH